MKRKHLIVFFLFVTTTGMSVWLISIPTPNFSNIVAETHKQINSLNPSKPNKGKPTKERVRVPDSELDHTYLELLGFVSSPKLYPDATFKGLSLPVIATGVTADNYENAMALVGSVQRFLPNRTVIIYDLGLGSYEMLKMKKYCNSSDVCLLRHFDFDKFPSHLKDYLYMQAYLPAVLQQALMDYGAVLWIGIDVEDHFLTGDISAIVDMANRSGIVAWMFETRESTSAYTHPHMFMHYNLHASKFNFQHMIDTSHLILYNTKHVHTNIMLPWARCCLSWSCISPVGAEANYCVQRKPRYLYSGCHRYATSALNIILGKVYNYDDEAYSRADKATVFGRDKVTTEASNQSISVVPDKMKSRTNSRIDKF